MGRKWTLAFAQILAPPRWPVYLLRGSRRFKHNQLLVLRETAFSKPSKGSLDNPRLELPTDLVFVQGIKLHTQTKSAHRTAYRIADEHDSDPLDSIRWSPSCSCSFNRLQGGSSRRTVALEPPFRELEQEGLGSRDPALAAVFANCNHLAEHVVVRDLASAIARPSSRIAAPPFLKPCRPWRMLVPDLLVFAAHRERLRGHLSLSKSITSRWRSSICLSVNGFRPGLLIAA